MSEAPEKIHHPEILKGIFKKIGTKKDELIMISSAQTLENLLLLKYMGINLNTAYRDKNEILKSEARLRVFIEAGLDINRKYDDRYCICDGYCNSCENYPKYKCGCNVPDECGCHCKDKSYDSLLLSKLTPFQIRMVLDNGADLHANVFGRKAIHEYSKHGTVDQIKVLIEYGADIEAISDKKDQRPIHYALKNSNIEVAKFLIENGCDIEAEDSFNGWRPIILAIKIKDFDIVKIIVDMGCDLSYVDCDGKTIKDHAIKSEDHQIINYLELKGFKN